MRSVVSEREDSIVPGVVKACGKYIQKKIKVGILVEESRAESRRIINTA